MKIGFSSFLELFFCVILPAVFFSAWLAHIVYCLVTGKIGLMLFGAVLVPIGVIHGFMIWAGAV